MSPTALRESRATRLVAGACSVLLRASPGGRMSTPRSEGPPPVLDATARLAAPAAAFPNGKRHAQLRSTAMQSMSTLDSLFLHVENGVSHMHLGAVALFDGPAPTAAQLAEVVAGRAAAPVAAPHRGCLTA